MKLNVLILHAQRQFYSSITKTRLDTQLHKKQVLHLHTGLFPQEQVTAGLASAAGCCSFILSDIDRLYPCI